MSPVTLVWMALKVACLKECGIWHMRLCSLSANFVTIFAVSYLADGIPFLLFKTAPLQAITSSVAFCAYPGHKDISPSYASLVHLTTGMHNSS